MSFNLNSVDTESEKSVESDEEIVLEWFETEGLHKPHIKIIKKKMNGKSEPVVATHTETEKLLFEQLAAMQEAMSAMAAQLNQFKVNKIEPSAPPAPTSISVEQHQLVKESLNEIRIFDGTSNIKYFLRSTV